MTALNLFPARVRFVNNDGTLTPEAYRALQIVFSRVGGALGDSGTDVFGQVFGAPTDSADNLSNALSDVVQPVLSSADFYTELAQPANFGTDFYSDVVQSPMLDMSFADVVQPLSKDREAGTFTTIDVSGNAAIGGTLRLASGTVGLPSLYWSTDTTTGFYRIGANNNGYAVGGVKLLDFSASLLAVTGAISATSTITLNERLLTSGNYIILGKNTNNAVRVSPLADAIGTEIASTDSTGTVAFKPMTIKADVLDLRDATGTGKIVISSTGVVVTGLLTTPGGATFHTTNTVLTNGAGAAAGTLTNAPAAGNPTKWIGINDNGTVRYLPAW